MGSSSQSVSYLQIQPTIDGNSIFTFPSSRFPTGGGKYCFPSVCLTLHMWRANFRANYMQIIYLGEGSMLLIPPLPCSGVICSSVLVWTEFLCQPHHVVMIFLKPKAFQSPLLTLAGSGMHRTPTAFTKQWTSSVQERKARLSPSL